MISFEPLWETMKKKGISQYKLIKEYKISTGQLDRLRKNGNVSTYTLDQLCQRSAGRRPSEEGRPAGLRPRDEGRRGAVLRSPEITQKSPAGFLCPAGLLPSVGP